MDVHPGLGRMQNRKAQLRDGYNRAGGRWQHANPQSNNTTAAPAGTTSRMAGDDEATVSSPEYTSGIAAAARSNSRPAPGRPPGKVEKSLCTRRPPLTLAC